ncbi:hypothetical protein SO574_23350 (plasmid) [Vibrio alfacsensis]|uniref:hypothetical protein n=1 Tax=Vibrio alfacsensis TaxID=1074311 RepID=UPI002ADDC54F|nr:hypothetical protein [Vibrio alfacsensis]WQE79477.1 hypothetical protein SO574_23350 [Vibrio alfacsensis]
MKSCNIPQKIKTDRFYRKLSSKKRKKSNLVNVIRKKPWKAKRKATTKIVLAPNIIDFYKPKHYEATVKFIDSIQKRIRNSYHSNKQSVNISFRNTKFITAAAAIYLFAQTARSVRKYPGISYTITAPQKVTQKGESLHLVDSVLNRLGFYELLGQRSRSLKEIRTVKCWHQDNGTVANGEIAGRIIEKLKHLGIEKHMLYRSSVEAISNAVEHGYDKSIQSTADLTDKTWWMFAAVLDNKLTILVSDLGHGIPNTLEKTQSSNILDEIWSMLGVKATKDCELIHASTLVKKTQTKKSNRGKGGKDLTSLVDHYKNSSLTIFSNRGLYRYHGKVSKKRAVSYDNKTPIEGTIVEWSIPLN